jgi:ABC-2 type transport system permease protein
MRGGALIVLDGRYRLNLAAQELQVEPVATGLEKLFAHWGIDVSDKLVMDRQNDVFPIPGERDLGNGVVVREIQQLPYPFFVHVSREAMGDNIMTSRLAAAVMHYVSPVRVTAPAKADDKKAGKDDKKGPAEPPRKVEVLLSSSDESWLEKAPQVQPDFRLYPQAGFGRPEKLTQGDQGPQPLAVAITGSFESLFAGKPEPRKGAQKDAQKDATKGESKDDSERLIERSPPDARVVVVGSSSFVTDELLELSQRAGAEYVQNNLELVQNMVDWAVADTDLLSIRSRGTHTRLLEIAPDGRGKWESINYGIVILGLGIVVALGMLRRRTLVPFELEPRGGKGGPDSGGDDDDKSEKDEEGRP